MHRTPHVLWSPPHSDRFYAGAAEAVRQRLALFEFQAMFVMTRSLPGVLTATFWACSSTVYAGSFYQTATHITTFHFCSDLEHSAQSIQIRLGSIPRAFALADRVGAYIFFIGFRSCACLGLYLRPDQKHLQASLPRGIYTAGRISTGLPKNPVLRGTPPPPPGIGSSKDPIAPGNSAPR